MAEYASNVSSGQSEPSGKGGMLRPLVNQWVQKQSLCENSKSAFTAIATQCYNFYSKSSGFMWEDEYRKTYLGSGIQKPKFQITLQKAFELVAIFGPYLFWKYPNIYIKTEDPVDLSPELFGDPNDPQIQQLYQQVLQEQSQDTTRQETRSALMEKYLNYTQREQPGGGLAVHGEMAITEALVKGRSCLWPETLTFPESNRTLTGRFYDSVDNLFIDPDCVSPTLEDAQYITRRHFTHTWRLERMFDLPRGSLKRHGSHESANSQAVNQDSTSKMYRRNGMTNDVMVWYETWSRAGVGTRTDYQGSSGDFRLDSGLHDAFDKQIGDYAYICWSPQVPWPLNCPEKLIGKLSDKQVKDKFAWRSANYGAPFPAHMDKRWPVALLDFHRDPDGCWPIAPLAPALGELTCMNILIAAFVEQGYENRKTIIAHMASTAKNLKEALSSNATPAIVELNDAANQSIDKLIAYIKRPEMNTDLLDAIQFLSDKFDKRIGLTEIMYAMNVGGAQSRTARDVQAKEEKAAIRPEKMAGDVAMFFTEAADLEKFLAGWTVEGKDLVPLLSKYGAYFWDELIATEDPEVFVREMRATVEAGDIRKPNKERLAQNLQNMLQTLLPVLQRYAIDTGETDQLNSFIAALGDSMEQDVGDWELGPWRPQPSPEEQQMQQAQMQLEQAKVQAEITIKQIEAQKAAAELEQIKVESQIDVQKSVMEMEQAKVKSQMDMAAGQMDMAAGQTDMAKRQLELAFDQKESQQDIQQSAASFSQEMVQDRAKHIQDILQKREENRVKLEGMQMQNMLKAQSALVSTLKPKTNGSLV